MRLNMRISDRVHLKRRQRFAYDRLFTPSSGTYWLVMREETLQPGEFTASYAEYDFVSDTGIAALLTICSNAMVMMNAPKNQSAT